MIQFEQVCRRADVLGLEVRGAFHPEPDEFGAPPGGERTGTVILLGFTGGAQWSVFRKSAEAGDGLPHPLDRWSRRSIGLLARELGAHDFYPSGSPPGPLPFQRLARRCEPVHPSPIGLLIHPVFGLWHAYRGGLMLAQRLDLPTMRRSPSPCESCRSKPCLSTCPVRAFKPGSFDIAACAAHVSSPAGNECLSGGCLARRACPVGAEFRYPLDQAEFHMRAFLESTALTN